jgi:hypothetical protein
MREGSGEWNCKALTSLWHELQYNKETLAMQIRFGTKNCEAHRGLNEISVLRFEYRIVLGVSWKSNSVFSLGVGRLRRRT